jgi:HSP20 family protein
MPGSRSSTQDQARQHGTAESGRGELQRQPSSSTTGVQRYSSDPFANQLRAFRRMSEEMDRIFDRAFGSFALGRPRGGGAAMPSDFWSPRIEAFQKDNQFIVRAELPGLKKEDVKVNVTDDSITIEGERKHEFEEDRGGVFHTERSYGSFYREIPLPEGAIGDKAEATFKDGVLEVKLDAPPREVTRGRTIEIK